MFSVQCKIHSINETLASLTALWLNEMCELNLIKFDKAAVVIENGQNFY